MPVATTLVSIISAVAAVFTAIGLVITAIAGLRRSQLTERKIDRADSKIAEVHVIVNQQRTDAMNYQRALIAALAKAGVEVPADQSVDPHRGVRDEG
jgi:hypothetical protein